ncbi:MAG: thioredoxin domain-containing protein [Thermoplasmata archaeon]|nr:MAG: thioredoxin domain-containing protein [Thermoplasmata archaeon]
MSAKRKANKLLSEKSPYLLQHAYNPVYWYPWGEEAFELAQREDKLIFLSIGYSTCHWCHVMEKESFEDPEVAELMNKIFVSIKVDREERPDIDKMYMAVCQLMTGGGGWPLTIFMTPDKQPFYSGTYIPKEIRFGRMGLMELLPRIQDLWKHKREDLLTSANHLTTALQQLPQEAAGKQLNESALKIAFNQLLRNFDSGYGGFDNAPKFPVPHNIMFLLRYWNRTGDSRALMLAEKTLEYMRLGGIYDHAGFGFHRYSTDAQWLVPHFEKMLYDQAGLTLAYLEAYQATAKIEYADTSREILTYVLRDMTSPEGGFYSAEDADSEGEEGKFYLWSLDEIREVLNKEEAELAVRIFNIEEDGNFIDPTIRKKTGLNILHMTDPLDVTAKNSGISITELKDRIESIRSKLFSHRKGRIHPHKDDKILTDWNGLMIAAFAKAAQIFNDKQYTDAASKSVDFIMKNLRDSKGRLLHRYRDDESANPGTLDDYAFLSWGLIELYEASFKNKYLNTAIELTDDMIKQFWDYSKGGFYFTGKDSEQLLIRQKEIYDGAIPSGNAAALYNLIRLAKLSGKNEYEKTASQLIKTFSRDIERLPSGHTMWMVGLDFVVGPSYEVIIRGDEHSEATKDMISALRTNLLPNKIVHLNPNTDKDSNIFKLPDIVEESSDTKDTATAYVCVDYSCQSPVTDVNKMLELLKAKKSI